jgi:SCP-2 sterol transfer family protein
MAHRFLSAPWLEEAQRLLRSSKEFHHALGGQSGAILAEITDAPGGGRLFLYYEFHDGALTRAEVGTNGDVSSRSAQFRITGTYESFVQLQKGELTLQAAYFKRKVRLTGDFQRAMRFAPAFLAYHEIVRRVETDY